MKALFSKLLYDRKDHELLRLVEEVLNREQSRKNFKNLLNPYLNPHGIKEMAASQGFRIAYAMAGLLHSLEIGRSDDRLSSLAALHDEVLNITHSVLRINTARVLLQIMKELVRLGGSMPGSWSWPTIFGWPYRAGPVSSAGNCNGTTSSRCPRSGTRSPSTIMCTTPTRRGERPPPI